MEAATKKSEKLSELVHPVIEQLPRTSRGIDRHVQLGNVVDNLGDDHREKLSDILDGYLKRMLKNDASDIDLGGPGCDGRVWYRIYGDKKPAKEPLSLSLDETNVLLHNAILPSQRKKLIEDKNLDFSYSIELGNGKQQRFRADMYFDLEHLALNMRKIDNTIRPFKNLNVHTEVAKALSLKYYKYGLTLITGITGSGKSSTLDTVIDANNRTVDSHIVIIASPVELIHTPIKSVVRHREVGRDVESFKEGQFRRLGKILIL